MQSTPKWYLPVTILALLWNLLGCAAYLSDVMLKPEDVAQMSAAQQALYASRTGWAVSATAIAVWGGAAGCIGLIWRKRWSIPLLILSLVGLIVQDAGLLLATTDALKAEPLTLVLQGLVLLIAIGLVFLGRKASAQQWIT